MKRSLPLGCLTALLLALAFSGCACTHEWQDATCTEPKTCAKCGEIEGEAHGHQWQEPTCTEPKTCKICGETEGDALGHEWINASCAAPKTCGVCGETEGSALGHTWEDATCTQPKTCRLCGETTGEALGHQAGEVKITKEPTCTAEGESAAICTVCGKTFTQPVEKLPHEPGEWVVTKEATAGSPGERAQSCTVCGETLAIEEFEMSPEEIEQAYKDSCKSYSYEEISRNPSKYEGEKAYFRGEIIQVIEQKVLTSTAYVLRVNVTRGAYTWKDTVYVTYYQSSGSDQGRLLEDDIITMYGTLEGTKTYETVLGASVTIPQFSAEYIDIE